MQPGNDRGVVGICGIFAVGMIVIILCCLALAFAYAAQFDVPNGPMPPNFGGFGHFIFGF